MNFFTHTVDAALWSSRAYDDREYDTAETEVLETPKVTLSGAPLETLIIFASDSARALLAVHYGETSEPARAGSVGDLPLYRVGTTGLLAIPDLGQGATGVKPEHVMQWTSAVCDALRPQRIVVLSSAPMFPLGLVDSDDADGVLTHLGSPKKDVQTIPHHAPAVLSGVAAAVLSECEYRNDIVGCAYTDCTNSVVFDGASLSRLGRVLEAETGEQVDEGERCARSQRYSDAVRDARNVSNGTSLYM